MSPTVFLWYQIGQLRETCEVHVLATQHNKPMIQNFEQETDQRGESRLRVAKRLRE